MTWSGRTDARRLREAWSPAYQVALSAVENRLRRCRAGSFWHAAGTPHAKHRPDQHIWLLYPDVWEVMVNGPAQIFVKRHVGDSGYHDEVFHDDDHVIRTLTKILDDASAAHRKLDPTEGLQDAQLDNGARLHIVHGDVSRGGHVMVNIRKFTGVAIRSLHELVVRETLTPQAAEFLRACVRAKQTILFAGPPGAGKTTMLSCCAAELDPSLRVVVAEEVFEADVPLATIRKSVCKLSGRVE